MPNDTRPWLSFDCYDTLVRYSESKATALAALVHAKVGGDEAQALAQETFETVERGLQKGPFAPLNVILRESLRAAFAAVGIKSTPDDEDTMITAVCEAEPFADVAPALCDLNHDHRLAILSNSEPDIIRHNIARIGVPMDIVVLATEAKCYKPAAGMFEALLARINAPASSVTHIAQSFYHDMRAAKDLGFGRRIWINRYGRTGDAAYAPNAELSDLSGVRGVIG